METLWHKLLRSNYQYLNHFYIISVQFYTIFPNLHIESYATAYLVWYSYVSLTVVNVSVLFFPVMYPDDVTNTNRKMSKFSERSLSDDVHIKVRLSKWFYASKMKWIIRFKGISKLEISQPFDTNTYSSNEIRKAQNKRRLWFIKIL